MFRYKLPIVIIIVNNGGIYSGLDAETYKDIRSDGDLTQMLVEFDFFFLLFYLNILRINKKKSVLLCYSTPPSALTVETRYEAMLGMFGHTGYFVKTISELRQSLHEALQVEDRPTILNVIIGPSSERKQQSFNWLTESKL